MHSPSRFLESFSNILPVLSRQTSYEISGVIAPRINLSSLGQHHVSHVDEEGRIAFQHIAVDDEFKRKVDNAVILVKTGHTEAARKDNPKVKYRFGPSDMVYPYEEQ
jgi:hypothetical protein